MACQHLASWEESWPGVDGGGGVLEVVSWKGREVAGRAWVLVPGFPGVAADSNTLLP